MIFNKIPTIGPISSTMFTVDCASHGPLDVQKNKKYLTSCGECVDILYSGNDFAVGNIDSLIGVWRRDPSLNQWVNIALHGHNMYVSTSYNIVSESKPAIHISFESIILNIKNRLRKCRYIFNQYIYYKRTGRWADYKIKRLYESLIKKDGAPT